MDAYDYAASRLDAGTLDRVDAFWAAFAEQASTIDRYFTGPEDMALDLPKFMGAALKGVSDDIMWEFGPSDRGHALTVTAEWRDDLRPLARALHDRAPDLPRWRFHEARGPIPDEEVIPMAEARMRRPLAIETVAATLGDNRAVDLAVTGSASAEEMESQAILLFSLMMGEARDRAWLGFVEAEGRGRLGGLLGKARKPATLDVGPLRAAIEDCFAQARDLAPDKAFCDLPLDDREVSAMQSNEPGTGPAPRDDLIVLTSAYPEMTLAQLNAPRFASERFSRFGETFVLAKIAREDERFDDVAARYDLEERLHAALSASRTGGLVGGAHGADHVYIDLALLNVEVGIETAVETLRAAEVPRRAWILFADPGLEGFAVPVWPDGPPPPRPDLN